MYDWMTISAAAIYFGIAFALFTYVSRYKFTNPTPVRIIGTVAMAIPPIGLLLMFALAMKAPINGPIRTT